MLFDFSSLSTTHHVSCTDSIVVVLIEFCIDLLFLPSAKDVDVFGITSWGSRNSANITSLVCKAPFRVFVSELSRF